MYEYINRHSSQVEINFTFNNLAPAKLGTQQQQKNPSIFLSIVISIVSNVIQLEICIESKH